MKRSSPLYYVLKLQFQQASQFRTALEHVSSTSISVGFKHKISNRHMFFCSPESGTVAVVEQYSCYATEHSFREYFLSFLRTLNGLIKQEDKCLISFDFSVMQEKQYLQSLLQCKFPIAIAILTSINLYFAP